MWNGNPANHSDSETARRLSIEMALAQHTAGVRPPPPAVPPHYGYVPPSEYQRQLAMQSAMHHPHHHAPHPHHHPAHHGPPPHHHHPWEHPQPHHEGSPQESASADLPPSEKVELPSIQPRGKPEAVAAQLASASRVQEKMDELQAETEPDTPAPETPASAVATASVSSMNGDAKKTDEKPAPKKRKRSPGPRKSNSAAKSQKNPAAPTMDDAVQPITAAEYENLKALMVQFCRVPLLAEFSRPVSLLHPELMNKYSKIVQHPMDLGKVCRKIRKKEYTCLRDVRLDAWRIFSNCIRYHSHPTNKDAVPSFVSIALHLRDYFNALWQEYMLPSDPPPASAKPAKTGPEAQIREAMNKRKEDRKKRLMVSGLNVMTGKSLNRTSKALNAFIENGGCVDRLDVDPLWGEGSKDDDSDLNVVVENLVRLKDRLISIQMHGKEYGVEELDRDFRDCYTKDVLENSPTVRIRVANRVDRFIGKICVPIHEATCRGVSQSSIWGCMAAAVWARESSKKPYWPSLVLGIMAPEDQKEDWHLALTERNEVRLPEKLRTQLVAGKRKAEQAIKRQNSGQVDRQSFFLVEFMGTHEFIWVRESDIVEDFDPNEDPNEQGQNTKKKKSTRSNLEKVKGSKLYNSALEEGKWALEEFELQLADIENDDATEEEDGEMNYSYSVLCQSDEEADEAESEDETDVEESNELLATEGLIDFTSTGRKKAKKKALDVKKQKADSEKKHKAKLKAEQTKKKKEVKKQERELERKRKKRAREREKALKGGEPKSKRRRVSASEDLKKAPSGRRHLIAGKQERATAIVKGYLKRTRDRDEYKTLCLGASIGEGVLTIPASMIDSAGLVGLALAFRAAAGEIPMPSESGDQSSNIKPWDAIEVDEKKNSSDREQLLLKQVELLEKEIGKVKSNTAKRLELAKEAKAKKKKMMEEIEEDDTNARQNPLKNKRKSMSPDKKSKEAKSPDSKADGEGKSEDKDSTMDVETEADDKSDADDSNANDTTDAGIVEPVEAAPEADVVETEEKDEGDEESPVVAEEILE